MHRKEKFVTDSNTAFPSSVPPTAPIRKDWSRVLGIVGALFGLACPPLGAALGIVSISQAKKHDGTAAWGYGAIGVSVLSVAIGTVVIVMR